MSSHANDVCLRIEEIDKEIARLKRDRAELRDFFVRSEIRETEDFKISLTCRSVDKLTTSIKKVCEGLKVSRDKLVRAGLINSTTSTTLTVRRKKDSKPRQNETEKSLTTTGRRQISVD